MTYTLHNGDCLVALRMMADNSIDAIVTDPPYGLSFMGKRWDYDVPSVDVWREALRVLKPGGHLLAFGGTRTYHRMVVNIEDAGFEIRDQIQWLYGQGFPKSLDVSKAIDKAAGAEREVVGEKFAGFAGANAPFGSKMQREQGYRPKWAAPSNPVGGNMVPVTAPATPDAERWQGFGTALKPANEPICMARKPFPGTVAANVLEWGTGAINVDGCRVETNGETWNGNEANGHGDYSGKVYGTFAKQYAKPAHVSGRWPANVVHDGSDDVVRLFPAAKSYSSNPETAKNAESYPAKGSQDSVGKWGFTGKNHRPLYGDTGSAARFFYTAKASKRDRDEGLEGMPKRTNDFHRASSGLNQDRPGREGRTPNTEGARNHHPTVKPTSLMQWLVRLVTPPGGTVLDPFMGSGSTGKACMYEGFRFVGIETDAEYVEIARKRIEFAVADVSFGLFAQAAD